MGLFDQLVSAATEAISGGEQGGLAQAAMGFISEHTGGLGGLVSRLQEGGLAQQVASWVGTGENLPVSGEQLQQALGGDTISQLAAKVGISSDEVSGGLANILPTLVDKLTPNGDVGEASSLLQNGVSFLSGLFNKG